MKWLAWILALVILLVALPCLGQEIIYEIVAADETRTRLDRDSYFAIVNAERERIKAGVAAGTIPGAYTVGRPVGSPQTLVQASPTPIHDAGWRRAAAMPGSTYRQGPFGGTRATIGTSGGQCVMTPNGRMCCPPQGAKGGIRATSPMDFGQPGFGQPAIPAQSGQVLYGGPNGVGVGTSPNGPFYQPIASLDMHSGTPDPKVVRIKSQWEDRAANGSGALLAEGYVVTCAHILKAGWAPSVFVDGRWISATIVASDAPADCAILKLDRVPQQKPIILAPLEPGIGELVRAAGWTYVDGSSRIRYVTGVGTVNAYPGPWISVVGKVLEGTSGGPIWTDRGVVSVVSQADNGDGGWHTFGPRLATIRKLLLEARGATEMLSGTFLDTSPQEAPIPPANASCQVTIQNLAEEVNKLRIRMDEAEACPLVPIPRGETGPPGPAGPAGPPGQGVDPKVLAVINERLATLEAKVRSLPPIRIQTLNQDGSVHQDVEARLGDLVKLKPVIVKPEAK